MFATVSIIVNATLCAGTARGGEVGFTAAKNYIAGSGPRAVAVGDFNGDRKLDLAVTNTLSDDVSILLGNGDGTFRPALNYTVGQNPQSLVVADFNRDGKLDLAVTNTGSGTVSILLGRGNGTFLPPVIYGAGLSPSAVAAGDFNKDGKLDLVVANHGPVSLCEDGSLSILLGDGDGTFQPARNYDAGECPSSIAVGDFNADGKLDLVTQAAVLRGNGDGSFQVPVSLSYGLGRAPGPVVVGDFNSDGKQDLAGSFVVGRYAFSPIVEILLGNGNGTFQPAVSYKGGLWPRSISIGDFNRDGRLDLATTGVLGSAVSILLGNGNGTFGPPLSFGVGEKPTSVAIGDFNGDGSPDLVVTRAEDDVVSVLLNTAGTIVRIESSSDPSKFSQSIKFTAMVAASIPGAATPTGTVAFKDGETMLGRGTLASGETSLTISSLGVGQHRITAFYFGDSTLNSNQSLVLTQTVLP
jgi:hypothetical protein